LGKELAHKERDLGLVPLDSDTIVVPVPDTAKAAADAMAFELKLPSVEGLMRNRYVGRTFIEGEQRNARVRMKYTPLRQVLEGKRVLLVEDTIVRSLTMKALLGVMRTVGKAKEIHVRVACPPIIAPCFYGIDMSTVQELFAPRFMHGNKFTREDENRMAAELGADSLVYLPTDSLARCIGIQTERLCRACVTGQYPTAEGTQLYQLALRPASTDKRTYEMEACVVK
jgi:amidophosphoribosyltransferase